MSNNYYLANSICQLVLTPNYSQLMHFGGLFTKGNSAPFIYRVDQTWDIFLSKEERPGLGG